MCFIPERMVQLKKTWMISCINRVLGCLMHGASPYMHSRMQAALPKISEWELNPDTEIANIFKYQCGFTVILSDFKPDKINFNYD